MEFEQCCTKRRHPFMTAGAVQRGGKTDAKYIYQGIMVLIRHGATAPTVRYSCTICKRDGVVERIMSLVHDQLPRAPNRQPCLAPAWFESAVFEMGYQHVLCNVESVAYWAVQKTRTWLR